MNNAANKTVEVYGIKTCSTVTKSLRWLSQQGFQTVFHDLKKEPLSSDLVTQWFQQVGIDKVINKRGLTWRKLNDEQKALTKTDDLIQLVIANPTLVKRPVTWYNDTWSVGFKEPEWQQRFV